MSLKRFRNPKVVIVFIIIFSINLIQPSIVFALSGGPSQPEIQSFEPVGTSEMVDLFSGDFNYNIPLLDVEGYPINIAYHSGISMDQEASWVGLGWNINPGAINRDVRGIPDDFSGEKITKEFNMRNNRTFGLTLGQKFEIFGLDTKIGFGANVSVTGNYNNYRGLSIEKSISLSISAGQKSAFNGLSGNLGLTSSSDEGLTIQPSLNYSKNVAKKGRHELGLGIGISSSFNSRAGLKAISISKTVSFSEQCKNNSKFKDQIGTSSSYNFAMSTYTPQMQQNYKTFSVAANFGLGEEYVGGNHYQYIGGYYSNQKLDENVKIKKAYGYMYVHRASDDPDNSSYKDEILDFNREKDGSFNKNMAALPLTNFTYDVYSVAGQGIGGSYRAVRNDFGSVYDTKGVSRSDSWSIGAEYGAGNLSKLGGNVGLVDVQGESGAWIENNITIGMLKFRGEEINSEYEPYYFREASEKCVDPNEQLFENLGGSEPIKHSLNKSVDFNTRVNPFYESASNLMIPLVSKRNNSAKRKQILQPQTKLSENLANYLDEGAHQISKLTTYSSDGKRYIYGLPVYNLNQEDVTFSVGSGLMEGNDIPGVVADKRLVKYSDEENSISNKSGIDHYFSKTKLPNYAYSYLLTQVFSPDYVDSDNINGPSEGDIGDYTLFEYYEPTNYKWRSPCGVPGEKLASYNEGLKSDLKDDKANYIYGEKQIRYLKKIETKNMVAEFILEDRFDGYEIDVNGNIGNVRMKSLKKIVLSSKTNNANNPLVLIKTVNFEYNYELCPNTPNNIHTTQNAPESGKLTLKKIYFTYGKSESGRLNPYEFYYNQPTLLNDPETVDVERAKYSTINSDRWGNYKSHCGKVLGYTDASGGYSNMDEIDPFLNQDDLPNQDFPYAQQVSDNVTREEIDDDASIWTLNKIVLPSGGVISLKFESDDYGYVQNKRAMEMFKVLDITSDTNNYVFNNPANGATKDFGTDSDWLIVKMRKSCKENGTYGNPNEMEYFENNFMKDIYFKFLILIKDIPLGKKHFEYVSGYAQLKHAKAISGGLMAIKLKGVSMNDNGNSQYNPIAKAGVQFARLNLSKLAYGHDTEIDDATDFGKDVLVTLMGSSILLNMIDMVQGPNLSLYNLPNNVANKFVLGKSFLRLYSPDYTKCGGGLRVKSVLLEDNWKEMTLSQSDKYKTEKYGQTYTYKINGHSSGVASYEPMLGGEENPFRSPIAYNDEKKLVPDDEFYQENPFGESFFPGAGVGYSCVKVRDIYDDFNTVYDNSESTVYEFYTAKDFPTITKKTDIEIVPSKDDESFIKSIFNIKHRDFMVASQGFSVETNDMHGKSKSITKYHKNVSTPYSSVLYEYQVNAVANQDGVALIPDNKCRVINSLGQVSNAQIGMTFDLISDFRHEYNKINSGSIAGNTDVFFVPGVPLPLPAIVPSVYGSKNKQETKFQSATVTKVIQRFGILKKETVVNDGSTVVNENIAYDAETGNVLLTKTVNNYNDSLFTLNIPSWWYYEGMGPAYMNIGRLISISANAAGFVSFPNAHSMFFEGDEIKRAFGNDQNTYYVNNVSADGIELLTKGGNKPTFGETWFNIIRSGRRNMLDNNMMTLTTMLNPLYSIATGNYERVLTASAVEYNNDWKTFCNCFDGVSGSPHTINPFVNGTKASWIPNKQYTYLTKRTQDLNNNNTNTRNDGVFEDFNPFYTITYNAWGKDYNNWTFVTEATQNNPFRGVLESKDALDNYNASLYGFKQTLTTAVADNTKYQELGYDHFEDYNPFCADKHFKFDGPPTTNTEAHTGNKSIRVALLNSPATLSRELVNNCPVPPPCFTYNGSNTNNVTSIIIGPANGINDFVCYYTVLQGNPIVNVSVINVNTYTYTITGNNWKIKFDNHGRADCAFSKVVNYSDF